MKTITFTDPHRKKHFEFFQKMEWPHFSLVAQVPFVKMRDFITSENLHFTSTVVYLICKSANAIPQFRWRIRDDQVVEHELVHPSFSVQTKNTDVFSFCYVDYQTDFTAFAVAAQKAIRGMYENPLLEDTHDRDDYLFLSSIPWVHFTGFSHAMPIKDVDSVPRIIWGKLGPSEDDMKLPLGVQAHHGVVDGRHVGLFYEYFESLCCDPVKALG